MMTTSIFTSKTSLKRNKTFLSATRSFRSIVTARGSFIRISRLQGTNLNLNQTTPSTHRATSAPENPANEGDSNR